MSESSPPSEKDTSLGRFGRLAILVGGIVLGQCVLYGPSLLGLKILLPLDILAGPGIYLPQTPEVRAMPIENIYLSDLIYVAEPARVFAAREFSSGRLASWAPFQFSGSPLLAPIFSPILGPQHLIVSPVVLAWGQLWAALVAGIGAYAFWRRALNLGYWPATLVAWCYPLTAFFVFWQGYYTAAPVCLLPWILLAVDSLVRRRARFAAPGLALATAATLLSGALDIAGQVLLVSGLYGIWALNDERRRAGVSQVAKSLMPLSAAWLLGFALASPWVLPVLDYSKTGARVTARVAGKEERPPTGLSALPQVVLPDMYGAFGVMKTGSFRISGDSQQESSAAAYAGMAATLLAAPLAWSDRRRRSLCGFMTGLACLGLAWCLNLPGVVDLLRLPGLNMMSHNRFVFAAAFATLTMSSMGLEVLRNSELKWRGWLWGTPAVLAGLAGFCVYRSLNLPEPVATQLEQIVQSGRQAGWIKDVACVHQVQDWYIRQYTAGALLSGLALAGWLILRTGKVSQPQLLGPIGIFLAGDLLWFGFGRNVQADPELYFPPVPALQELASSAPGRVIGAKCLPANLAAMCGLEDVRGYDGVDPSDYVALLRMAADPSMPPLTYALTQWQAPAVGFGSSGEARLSPILDLLGVTHVIFQGAPPAEAKPIFQSSDYSIVRNAGVLPRAFVPERVEVLPDPAERLARLAAPGFDPREVCFIEGPVTNLPGICRGQAQVQHRSPTHMTVDLQMQTAGMVVLADRWDKGWRALLNGQPTIVHRVNHALRGIIVPAGTGRLELRYRPKTLVLGLTLASISSVVLIGWTVAVRRRQEASSESRYLATS